MRKNLTALTLGLLVLFFTTVSSVQADIQQFSWLPPWVYKGYDSSFYQTNIIGYKENTTASLQVPVYNGQNEPINVSSVKISFDWGINYTSSEASMASPVQVQYRQTRFFTINFTVPTVDVASNSMAHTYRIYVELVNATTDPKEIIDTWTVNWDRWSPAYRFAVFSRDQADAYDLMTTYQAYYNTYPLSAFTDKNASILAGQARVEMNLIQQCYARGEFAGAKTRLQKAIDLYNQALTSERSWGMTYQQAQLNVDVAQAEAAKTQADAAVITANAVLNQSYAWILFGTGFIIISIGVLLYLMRKT